MIKFLVIVAVAVLLYVSVSYGIFLIRLDSIARASQICSQVGR